MTKSPVTVQDVLASLNSIASFSLAEAWDNVGLLVGDPSMETTGILLALDPTVAVLEEALELDVNIIITHHPVIFHPLKTLRLDHPQVRLLSKALQKNVAVIGCHTNLDLAGGGVNDVLAAKLGLTDIQPFPTQKGETPDEPSFGRIGRLTPPLAGDKFLQQTMNILKTPTLRVAGQIPDMVDRVAVCGGSGGELAETAWQAGSQIFLTSEVKHDIARWSEEAGLCIIDGGHFPTENIIIPTLAEALRQSLSKDDGPKIYVTANQSDVFTYINHNNPSSTEDVAGLRQP